MHIKYNLNEIMIDKGISLNELSKNVNLSINTIRKIKNSTEHNPTISILQTLAQTLNCDIIDLIDEETWMSFYHIIAKKRKENPLFKKQQFFSLNNITILKKALLNIGVFAEFIPGLSLTSLFIKNQPNKGPVFLDLYLRINTLYLEVIDFYVHVNQKVAKEENIKNLIVETLEQYAKQNNIENIIFYNLDGTDPADSFNHYCETNLLNPTYQYNPKIDVKVLNKRGYTLQESPCLPGNLGDQWIKELGV